MRHYFSPELPEHSNPQAFAYQYAAQKFTFTTDSGVFSVGKMDEGTDLLLRNIPPLSGSLLDLGCGFGCIGIVLAKCYNLTLTQADINPRAAALTRQNALQNGVASQVLLSDGFEHIRGCFDTITLNPPIHAGKQLIFKLYQDAFEHLTPGGQFFIVIRKKHGAESTLKRLRECFGNCEILYKKKGCFVVKSQKK